MTNSAVQNKKISSAIPEFIFTEEESKKIILILRLLTDIVKNSTIERGSMTNEEFQIALKNQKQLLASKIVNKALEHANNEEISLDNYYIEIIRRYCLGDIELSHIKNIT